MGPIAVSAAIALGSGPKSAPEQNEEALWSIVQASSVERAAAAVQAAGGEFVRELSIIRAVSARLTPTQKQQLESQAGIDLHADHGVQVAGEVPETYYPSVVGPAELHEQGIDGYGVAIAVIDTGIWKKSGTQDNRYGDLRLIAQYDVILDRLDPSHYDDANPDYTDDIHDYSGHGTHVAAVAVSSDQTDAGRWQGIAPGADLVAVKAFDADGSVLYSDVIAAIDWVVDHKDEYGIRVLNLSFSAEPRSYYWDDPLNQAVMAAWRDGIVVVASAGNRGPDPMTVGVPGNVPYVITVGAMTDQYSPWDGSDDTLASFSSAGPTVEGHIKPDVVAPGGHMIAWLPDYGTIANEHPDFAYPLSPEYFEMSGTSQAAGVVSGVVALMLLHDRGGLWWLIPLAGVVAMVAFIVRAESQADEVIAGTALRAYRGGFWIVVLALVGEAFARSFGHQTADVPFIWALGLGVWVVIYGVGLWRLR